MICMGDDNLKALSSAIDCSNRISLSCIHTIFIPSSTPGTSEIARKRHFNVLKNIYLALGKTYHLSIAGKH